MVRESLICIKLLKSIIHCFKLIILIISKYDKVEKSILGSWGLELLGSRCLRNLSYGRSKLQATEHIPLVLEW